MLLLRTVVVGGALWLCFGAPTTATAGPPSARKALSCIPAAQCCKVCDTGMACGNSCISRKKQCHKGRGCACDSAEICAP